MKQTITQGWWICLCLFSWTILLGQDQSNQEYLQHEIDKIIRYDTNLDPDKTPGMIISLMIGDSTFRYSYGSKEPGSKNAILPESIFELGSLTKPFTATLIQHLHENELIDGNKSINEYLPEQYRNALFEGCSIFDCLNHTSGLPKYPPKFGLHSTTTDDPYADYSKRQLLLDYSICSQQRKKGEYHFSHFGYAIVEVALEFALRQPFQEIMEEYLFHPLEMNDSHVGSHPGIITGYSRNINKSTPWTFRSFAGSEGVCSSVLDLEKFVRDQMNDSKIVRNKAQLHSEMFPTGLQKETFGVSGWHIFMPNKKTSVIVQQGQTGGHKSFTGFVKETNTAVILLSNSAHSTEGLGLLILRMLNYNWDLKKTLKKSRIGQS